MSVRRLAEDHLQPASFAFSKAMQVEVKKWQKKYPKGREQSAVIPLLMLAQEQEGWVSKAAIEHVSDMLAMPKIRVLEVATFYTQFQLQPVGTRAHIQVCGTTPCMLRGSEALMDVCRKKIHPEQFHTNEAGTLSWEEVECLGACVNAPMVMVFKDTYEDLTPERLEEIIDAFEAGKGAKVTPGPQVDRIYSAPESGLTSLTDEKALTKAGRARAAAALGAAEAVRRAGEDVGSADERQGEHERLRPVHRPRDRDAEREEHERPHHGEREHLRAERHPAGLAEALHVRAEHRVGEDLVVHALRGPRVAGCRDDQEDRRRPAGDDHADEPEDQRDRAERAPHQPCEAAV